MLLNKQRRSARDCERAAELFRSQLAETDDLLVHLDLADALNCASAAFSGPECGA